MAIRKIAVVAAATGVAFGALGVTGAANAQEVTLRGVNCFPVKSPPGRPFEAFIRKLNKAGKGVIQIKLLGGAPAIGSNLTVIRRVSRGAFDIAGCPDAYYGNIFPEAGAIRLMEHNFTTARTNGALAYLNKLLAEKNLIMLGQTHNFGPFFLFLSKPITGANLKGLHLRTAPVYVPFFKALGATVQNSNFAQVYTYMENGTVQGFGWPALGWNPGWIKVTKYRVEPGFYRAGIQTLMNLAKYKSLSANARGILDKVVLEHEKRTELWPTRLPKQKAWMRKNGMKTIVLRGAARQAWLNTATNSAWAEVLQRSPKHGAALRKLVSGKTN